MQEHIKHVHDGEQRPVRPRKRKLVASLEESDEDERGGVVVAASEVIADNMEESHDVKVNRNKLSPFNDEKDDHSVSEITPASSEGGRQRKPKIIFDL